ncbi:MAG: hypothetical protein IT280_12540 [Ignavibacteria bacterium]|nr:hypothetical protein [Ignavibacteria bacterium]
MKFSKDTIKILNDLKDFSGGKLKNPDDIGTLMELAENNEKHKLFYDIEFTAKYLNGLSKILQSNTALSASKNPGSNGETISGEDEARKKIMDEYKTNMMKFTNYLKNLLGEADEFTKKEMEEKYLKLSQETMRNLNILIYDLSWLKKFNNSRR